MDTFKFTNYSVSRSWSPVVKESRVTVGVRVKVNEITGSRVSMYRNTWIDSRHERS